jgi:hypothetical protein
MIHVNAPPLSPILPRSSPDPSPVEPFTTLEVELSIPPASPPRPFSGVLPRIAAFQDDSA